MENIVKKNGRADITVASAGVSARPGVSMTDKSKVALKKNGEKLGRKARRSVPWDDKYLDEYDHIIAMTQGHADAIGNYENVYTLGALTHGGDVDDPYMGGQDVYNRVYARLRPDLEKLYQVILQSEQIK